MLFVIFNQTFLHFCVYFLVLSPLFCAFCLGYRMEYFYCKYDTPQRMLKFFISTFFFYALILLFSAYCCIYYQNINFSFFWSAGVWFSTSSYNVPWNFIFDSLSAAMFFIVICVSSAVHFYSLSYMKNDPHLLKFIAYLSLFTFFMLVLVSAGNLVQLFIGWEGVGLCSFLLISFWSERVVANKAAIKAMVVNKIGDFCILFGIALLLQTLGTSDFKSCLFYSFFNCSSYNFFNLIGFTSVYFSVSVDILFIVCLFLVLGAMAKSAQFGFHTWLPDAMEGPTPVSALIHAATMVTAGVFLLLRISVLLSLSLKIQFIVLIIGLLTMFFAASVALFQHDIKRVIAYSTCSQLGYMFAACGLSFYGVAFFHLLTHAFFKALLFLGAGAVIHFFNDEQDMRKMGGAFFYNPLAFVAMTISSFALLGFPFSSGYYSKDWLLELFFVSDFLYSGYAYFVAIFVALFTAFYSFRLLFLVFLNKPSGLWINYFFPHKEDRKINLVFVFLGLFTIFFGYFFKMLFSAFLFFSSDQGGTYNLNVPLFVKLLPLFVFFLGGFLAYIYVFSNRFKFIVPINFYIFYDFVVKRWYVDNFLNIYFSYFFFSFSYFYSFLTVEKGWIEFFGPSGGVFLLFKISLFVNALQNREFVNYLFFIFVFLFFFIIGF